MMTFTYFALTFVAGWLLGDLLTLVWRVLVWASVDTCKWIRVVDFDEYEGWARLWYLLLPIDFAIQWWRQVKLQAWSWSRGIESRPSYETHG